LTAIGASPPGVWFFGVLPASQGKLLAHLLFRFEVNVRVTVMVGIVGAGGLGDVIHTAISLFQFQRLSALLCLLIGAVVITEQIARWLRRRIVASDN